MNDPHLLALLGFVIDTTIKGSVVILLVALLTSLAGRRLGPRWRHALWLVALLRLAIPAGPVSRWSVFNLLPLRERAMPVKAIREIAAAGGSPAALRTAKLAVGVLRNSTWTPSWHFLLAVWLCGATAVALHALLSALRTRVALRHAAACDIRSDVVEAVKARLRIRRRFLVVESTLVDAPALHGLWRPVLLLPRGFSGTFDREELRHVVLHELWHLRRFDLVVNWALSVAQAIHWFNPLIWFAASRIREERELACDELALSCLEEDERLGYGRTILKLLERFRAATPVPALVGIVNHKRKMKRRLLMITNYRNRVRFSVVFAATLAVVGLVGLTDARGGERRLRELDPAAMETGMKMRQHISIDLTDASIADLLTAVANKTGVAFQQSPGTASSTVQQARFTMHADNVPAIDLLVMTLAPFHLAPQPEANGVTVYKLVQRIDGEPGDSGQRQKMAAEEGQRQKLAAEEAHGGPMIRRDAQPGEEVTSGELRTKIFIHSADGSDSLAPVINPDGTVHRSLTFTMEEKGVPSEGKLVLDIKGVKAD
jgi:beta-lactamase regulating signal transducer with metallopeptidase domain